MVYAGLLHKSPANASAKPDPTGAFSGYNVPMAAGKLSHLDDQGRARMVDVGQKTPTQREATAEGYVLMQPATLRAIAEEAVPKGEVLNTARIAGILAAKRCGELIPLCHPLPIESVEVHFEVPQLEPDGNDPVRLHVRAIAKITGKTGVEMEALTAVSVAALTIYDMCKAIDKTMVIDGIRVVSKIGGKSSAG
jgi:cyclic pyranopterin phosphate synthase